MKVGDIYMSSVAKVIDTSYNVSSDLQELLNSMNDSNFVKKFYENPQNALYERGININLSDLSSILSENQELYNDLVERLSQNIDTTIFNQWTSSCCS